MDRRLYAEAARARKAAKLVVAARRLGLTGADLANRSLIRAGLVRETGVNDPSAITWALAATLLDELPAFTPERGRDTGMTAREWGQHVGRRVIFRYHGEEATGEVSSVSDRFVFVRFGLGATAECDPSQLRLEVPA